MTLLSHLFWTVVSETLHLQKQLLLLMIHIGIHSGYNEFSSPRNPCSIIYGSDWVGGISRCKYFTQCRNLTAWKQKTSSCGREQAKQVHEGFRREHGEHFECCMRSAALQHGADAGMKPLYFHRKTNAWLRLPRPLPQ